MAEVPPELQAKLEELDTELEEGEITRKGYEKRRTLILNQYLSPEQVEQVQSSLRIHSADDTSHPSRSTGGSSTVNRSQDQAEAAGGLHESFASIAVGPYAHPSPGEHLPHGGNGSLQADEYTLGNGLANLQVRPPTPSYEGPPGQVQRFQERQMGMRPTPGQRQSSYGFTPGPASSYASRPQSAGSQYSSGPHTMVNSDYAWNPDQKSRMPSQSDFGDDRRLSTMLDSAQGYFSDFAGQQRLDSISHAPRESYGGPQRYSQGEAFSPTAAIPPPLANVPQASIHLPPLEPRDVPFAVYDPHNSNIPMSKFDNIGAVLRHRGKMQARQQAYWVLDSKGKEVSAITWEKLASRAEKVAQVIRDKSNLYRGDRVALVYRDNEVIDFAIALMGCFLAGVVAVPINNVDDYHKLSLLLTTTQCHLALTTDANLKIFHRDISAQKLKWPPGVEWWKTNEFGSYHPKKKDESAPLQVPDLAYIEFSRAPTGDLRGVVLSHRTIMHQMACLSAMMSTIPKGEETDTFSHQLRTSDGTLMAPRQGRGETILSYLDPREGCGLITGVLLGVYGGHTTVWLESKTVETPGMYAHLITKYRASIMIADYPGLKRAAYNYQQDPMATRQFKKNMEPNFSAVKICLIDTLTVDCEFHEILADRWLKPMRNTRAREIVAPMLCLPEHGGMIISVRDWLGGEERMGCPLNMEDEDESDDDAPGSPTTGNGYTSLLDGSASEKKKAARRKRGRTDLSEVLLDKESLKTNEVVVLAVGDEARKRANEPGTVRAGAFGYPIPDATLALVDPETNLLCAPFSVGEIWVDSPSLSGGFWALPKHTETIFHARPYRFIEGSPTPVLVEPEFLRTGLLGCIIEGKVYVLGLYEDRIRQRVEWVEHGANEIEHRYFFVQHLVVSVMRTVPRVYDCSAFDAHVNGEYLPIILIETQAASTAPTTTGGPPRQLDIPFLDSLSERVMEVLYQEHHLRVYCVMMTAPNTLPRVIKNGRRDIGNMLCRKEFDNGNLPCVHVKFGVERAVQNLPLGDDPAGGVWSPMASQSRLEMLAMHADKQYSGVDHREVVIDDRTSTPLNNFTNIHDLMQWRVARQAEELSYCTIDGRGREGKGINWKKFDTKVAAVAMYLKNKVKVQPGDHLLLMYTHSEDFVYAVHACICLGAIAVPMAPIDSNRLSEDAPALLHMMADFRIKAILVNADVDQLMKQKAVAQHLKQSALILKVNLPNSYNTTKPPKQSHGCRDLGLTIRPAWVQPGYPVLIWTYWTPDQRRIAIQLGHENIMALCKVQKETCQMTSTRPVLGCVRSTMGLGFLHTCMMGIFLAAPTYLVSPVDFAQNPNILFQTLSRYKIKDTYATSQMLDHAIAHGAGKNVNMFELKNLMISTEQRPRAEVYSKVRQAFAQSGLERTAINTIYSHVLNPMVASRSYMCIEPIELYLDASALRRGLVVPVDPDQEPFALMVQDSGMVPVSTQISIVNPETNRLCLVGEYGEIWVQSEANAHSFYGSKDAFDAERFNGRTVDGDPGVRYVRTGDLGFLHNVSRPIGPGGNMVEMQVLFVLGGIGETFEVNGLQHFPMDVENSVERCHRAVVRGGCAIFQAGSLLVLVAEVRTRAYLASLVPVIVNAVLNEHQLVLDIVAFVALGDFPRSRLGEKQRGKILASWVSRKMRTVAQFSIRDPDAEGSVGTIMPEEAMGRRGSQQSGKAGVGSLRRGNGTAGSSLRHVESVAHMPLAEESPPGLHLQTPEGYGERPLGDHMRQISGASFENEERDDTPTNETPRPLTLDTGMGYEPARAMSFDASDPQASHDEYTAHPDQYQTYHAQSSGRPQYADESPVIPQASFGLGNGGSGAGLKIANQSEEDSPVESQMSAYQGLGGGRSRVANRSSAQSDDWGQDALRHMNLGGG
ncbi:DMAP1-binding Domain [Teratosphaeria destructans]|uniref:DMAP1-binding Domain n=1 Tax=Teratosphaeria destructans TaxID=418781 RepID=A0A9W7W1I2_9PEZI|nr:DMAP1-binding Domain [Teratosphaeria destructans]